MSSLPGMPLRLVLRAAGCGESLLGWVCSGKPLKPLLGLPCAAGEGGGLPVSPEPFPCQALPSLGLSGVGGVAPALPLRYLRTTPFPTARPFGGLCLRGGLLVARPWLLPSGYRLLIFRCGGRCGWCLVAVGCFWCRFRKSYPQAAALMFLCLVIYVLMFPTRKCRFILKNQRVMKN